VHDPTELKSGKARVSNISNGYFMSSTISVSDKNDNKYLKITITIFSSEVLAEIFSLSRIDREI